MSDTATHTVNIHEAKTHFSRLVRRAQDGADTVICREGQQVARLVPYVAERPSPRRLGGWEGQIRVADDFDELPDELQAAFAGEAP